MGVPASRESLLAPPGIELRGKLLEAVPIRPTHEDIIRSNVELIRLLLRLETRYVNLRKRFDELFEKLPKVARRIATYCRDDYLANGYDPGEVRFYMIGGRTHFSFEDGVLKPQSLRRNSDIDFFLAVERPTRDHELEWTVATHTYLQVATVVSHALGFEHIFQMTPYVPEPFPRELNKPNGKSYNEDLFPSLERFADASYLLMASVSQAHKPSQAPRAGEGEERG